MDPLTLINADCLTALRGLPAESVQCCVTSPPYYGLRDYGHAGQIGLEDTPGAYVARLVEVFDEVRRVLRKDGTLWLNLGDSYAGSGRGTGDTKTTNKGNGAGRGVMDDRSPSRGSKIGSVHGDSGHTCYSPPPKGSCLPAGFHEQARLAGNVGRAWVKPPGSFKSKDLLGIPWRVAFALQHAGWYLRQDIIWHKPAPMPESVTDRCTKSHEYIFLLSKSAKYYYDADAIAEPAAYGSRGSHFHTGKTGEHQLGRSSRKPRQSKKRGEFDGKTNDLPGREAFRAVTETRNKRSVWTVPTQPFAEAHFATFPPDLVKPCVLAAAPPGSVVLDPFGGSGTTGMVALELGRRALLIELNPDYCDLIRQRCAITPGLALTA